MKHKHHHECLSTHANTEEGPERPKHLDEEVCSCPSYIVTIDPPKGHWEIHRGRWSGPVQHKNIIYIVMCIVFWFSFTLYLRHEDLTTEEVMPPCTSHNSWWAQAWRVQAIWNTRNIQVGLIYSSSRVSQESKNIDVEWDKVLVESLCEVQKASSARRAQMETTFALEVAGRLKRLPPKDNAYAKLQIQEILFDIKFGQH